MRRGRKKDCWNCGSRFPVAEFKHGRCPACGVRSYPNPVFVTLGFAIAGALVGWLGGFLGIMWWLCPESADVLYLATWGMLVGLFVFGWVGFCSAVLFTILRVGARSDPEVRERASLIRRMRAEKRATAGHNLGD
jgi:hypothetical protein